MQKRPIPILLTLVLFLAIAACSGGGGGDGNSGGGGDGDSGDGTSYGVAITALETPDAANAGEDIIVNLTVYNEGNMLASPGTIIYLSLDDEYDLFDSVLDISLPSLTFAAGATQSDLLTITIPANLPNGTYYVVGYMPMYDQNPEVSDIHPANNTWANAIVVSGTSCSADACEDDDALADATPISPGDVLDNNFCDDGGDWYVMDAVAGQSYTIRATVVGSALDSIIMDLFDDGISEPLSSDAVGHLIDEVHGLSEAVLTWMPDATGIYYLRVGPFLGLRDSGPDTDYQLTLN